MKIEKNKAFWTIVKKTAFIVAVRPLILIFELFHL